MRDANIQHGPKRRYPLQLGEWITLGLIAGAVALGIILMTTPLGVG